MLCSLLILQSWFQVPKERAFSIFLDGQWLLLSMAFVLFGMLIVGLISAISLLVDDVSESNQEKARLIHKTQSLEMH